jgi:NTE family protein
MNVIRLWMAAFAVGVSLTVPAREDIGVGEHEDPLEARLEPVVQERLINWGYAICDAAMRKWMDATLAKPAGFPYRTSGVG